MNNKTFRIIVLCVALTLLLSTAVFATMNASAYITATNAWITRSGNTVNVNFSIVGNGNMDKIGVKYVYLYEQNGNSWDLVKTFSYTNSQYELIMMDTDIGAHAGYLSYSGFASKNYFADCRFYAERNGGSDTIQQDTPTSYGTP